MKNLLENRHLQFLRGSSRLDEAKKNIFYLFILHSLNLALMLLLVPITLDCLSPAEYGIWLTITSVTGWFISLDFGLGNGLRNKLAETLAKGKKRLAKIYVSTTYAYLSGIIFIFYIVFLSINPFLRWSSILNVPPGLAGQINTLVVIVFSLFTLNFVLRLISTVVIADQKPAINGLLTFFINLITVLSIFILSKSPSASLLNLGIISSLIPGSVYIIASIVLFRNSYRAIRPSFRYIKTRYSSGLLSLGIRFFIIQISTLIVFATDNLIITQIFGPSDVTTYNIAFKYFNIIPLVFGVILAPFWSAYTEAFTRQDISWIKNVNRKLIRIWILLVFVIFVMIFVSGVVYRIWVGSEIKIPGLLSILMGIFAIITMWNNIFSYFLNGVGKIRLQLYSSIFSGVINIPLSIFFAKNLNLGISGVILGTIACLSIASFWAPVQYYKIVNFKAQGIWNA